ncbi:AraC family ligand binding domain-containing protein [Mucilaginibacter sp. UC70_90]
MNAIAEPKKRIKEGFIGQKMIVLPPNIKKAITSNALIKGFYLTAIGYYPKAAFHDRERRTGSNEYIFLYCVDGEGYVYLGGQGHTLKPNTFFIIPRNVAHRYKSSETNPWSIYWVHFSGLNSHLIYERSLENGSLRYNPFRTTAAGLSCTSKSMPCLNTAIMKKKWRLLTSTCSILSPRWCIISKPTRLIMITIL